MSNELVEKVREDDRAMLLKTVMRTIERLAIPGETLASVATAAVNLVLEAAAEEMAKGDDGHDWSPEGAAAAIRQMKGESK